MAKKKNRRLEGKISKTKKGFGFVLVEDGDDIFVPCKYAHEVMNGDVVEVEVIPSPRRRNRSEGRILKVIERNLKEIIGTFEKTKSFAFVVPSNRKIGEDIFVSKKNFNGAKDGDLVVARITKYPDKKNSPEGKIAEIISRANTPGGDVKAILREQNIVEKFPKKVLEEGQRIESKGIQAKDVKGRIDLREKTIITIDGADAKDFDDGVSCEILANGNYLLGVHIADVSHYVEMGSNLDKTAFKRGTSIYLPDRVIPMLPEELSNGLCSLMPYVDRLTLSCVMEIDQGGKVVNHQVFESIISSKKRCIYEDVTKILEEGKPDKKYENVFSDLLRMKDLGEILNKRRQDRGSLDFDLDESIIQVDEQGIPKFIGVSQRGLANRIIEEFMLLANEVVAQHFLEKEIPFVYRVHGSPEEEKTRELMELLISFGITLKGDKENIQPKELKEILDKIKGKPYESVISTVMIRSMSKAIYDTECQGHFGLALKHYCHFTSPIRRYPDLIIHRMIKKYLKGKVSKSEEKIFRQMVKEAAEQSSVTERQAIDLEREVEKLKKAEYMSTHIGEIYQGVISGLTDFGMYVQLENTIEGMVHVDNLYDDEYFFHKSSYSFIGENTGRSYTLGDTVTIKVVNVSVHEREIDFILASLD